jgi:hypothetical protein
VLSSAPQIGKARWSRRRRSRSSPDILAALDTSTPRVESQGRWESRTAEQVRLAGVSSLLGRCVSPDVRNLRPSRCVRRTPQRDQQRRAWAVNASPTVCARLSMRGSSSAALAAASWVLSSASDSITGTGTIYVRREPAAVGPGTCPDRDNRVPAPPRRPGPRRRRLDSSG